MKYWVAALVSASMMVGPTAARAAEKPASVFVKCDGRPNTASTLGTVARLIAITAVVGLLLPEREQPDEEKRESGAEGVKACDAALNGDSPASDGGRRIELFFARAVHQMELSQWDAAIADIEAGERDQPALVATRAYRESLGLTARHLTAMALVGKGDWAAGRLEAAKMAAQAPYNIRNVIFAVDYARLVDDQDPAVAQLFDQYVRIYPLGLMDRGNFRANARRFAEAADDFRARAVLLHSLPNWFGYLDNAKAGIALRLAGDTAGADTLMSEARAESAKHRATGAATDMLSATSQNEDFYALLEKLDKGDVKLARTLFAARSRWDYVPPGFVAELSRRLEVASSPEERQAVPIQSDADIMAANRDWSAAVINDPGEKGKDRWRLFHTAFSDADFAKFSANTWRTDKSKYLDAKVDPDNKAQFINVERNGSGTPGAYAMYLHAALMAKKAGKKGFMLLPGQRFAYAHFIRIGSPGDPNIVEPLLFDADRVIADLGPYFPPPVKR